MMDIVTWAKRRNQGQAETLYQWSSGLDIYLFGHKSGWYLEYDEKQLKLIMNVSIISWFRKDG